MVGRRCLPPHAANVAAPTGASRQNRLGVSALTAMGPLPACSRSISRSAEKTASAAEGEMEEGVDTTQILQRGQRLEHRRHPQ